MTLLRQDKRLALDALDIQVKVTPEQIDIEGVIPTNISSADSKEVLLDRIPESDTSYDS